MYFQIMKFREKNNYRITKYYECLTNFCTNFGKLWKSYYLKEEENYGNGEHTEHTCAPLYNRTTYLPPQRIWFLCPF